MFLAPGTQKMASISSAEYLKLLAKRRQRKASPAFLRHWGLRVTGCTMKLQNRVLMSAGADELREVYGPSLPLSPTL